MKNYLKYAITVFVLVSFSMVQPLAITPGVHSRDDPARPSGSNTISTSWNAASGQGRAPLEGNELMMGHEDEVTCGESTRGETAGSFFQSNKVDFGDCTSNGVSVTGYGEYARVNLSNGAAGGWRKMEQEDDPIGRYGHKMVYDSTHEKIVMFGGRTVEGQSSLETWLFDTLKNEWTDMNPSPAPSGRYYHAMAYDSTNDKVVLFGGYWTAPETWTYDVGENSWTLLSPVDHPPRLYVHSMAYDSINDKVILFGGRTYSGGWRLFGETWSYDVASNLWTRMDPEHSPSPRYSHSMAFDPVNGRVVLFGGYNGSSLADTWTYDVSRDNWTRIDTVASPPSRYQHEMVYDTEVHRILLFGGYPYDADCWLFDPAANSWAPVAYHDHPSNRYSLGLAYDTTYRKMILFGGYPGYPEETWNHDFLRYSPSGTLSSPVITLPDGHGWDTISVEKTEKPGTYINLTVIDAITSRPVEGFTDMPGSHIDISELNGPGMTTIRLRAAFTGSVDLTPVLYSWGVQWKKSDMHYDGFIGDGNIRFSGDADESTSGLWRFDEGTGQILGDSSKNLNDGFLGGGDNIEPSDPKWVDGRFDGGLRFDGEDDFVWVDKGQSLRTDETLTVEMWFKPDGCGKGTMSLLGGRSQGDYAIQILENGTVKVLLSTIDLELDEYNELHSKTTVRADRWYHVALVFDRPHVILYLNGMEETRKTVDFVMRHCNVPLFIGAEVGSSHFPYQPTNFFYGIIEELRITNGSTEQLDILRDARGGLSLGGGAAMIGKNVPSLSTDAVVHYDLEEIRGNVIEDSSQNGIFGRVYGDGSITDGQFGGALELDGTGNFISISDSPLLHMESATYEFWIRYEGDGRDNILFLEEKEASSDINEMGLIDDKGRIHFMFDNGTYDITADETLSTGEWKHIVFVRSPNVARIFIDGEESGNGSYSAFEHDNGKRLFVGGGPNSSNCLGGLMDEIFIYNVPLPRSVIGSRGSLFLDKAGFGTRAISLPGWNEREPERVWDTFRMDLLPEEDTSLNITIRDNGTGEVLIVVPEGGSCVSVNLTGLNAIEHPSIYIEALMTSNGKRSPKILDWTVSWSEVGSPMLFKYIPDGLVIEEDTPAGDVLNLSEHFRDSYSNISGSRFGVEWLSEPGCIGISPNGSVLDVVYLEENWTGLVEVIVNCTNLYGRTRSSNRFAVIVQNIDDAPVWRSSPAPIALDEDGNLTLENYLSGHVYDVENNSLLYSVSSDNENITVELFEPDTLLVSGTKDYFGSGTLTATVYQKHNPDLNSDMTIPVTIASVNDPPNVILTSPKKHSIQLSTSISFSWKAVDVDSDVRNVSFSFYLSKTFPPLMYLSDLYESSVTIDELDDEATYFWKVIPSDGKSEGLCLNGTWSFNINMNVLHPETTHLAPLNGTIVTVRSVNLSWECFNPTMSDVSYRVLWGREKGNLSNTCLTNDTWLLFEGLDDNTTYFWKVVPVADLVEGICFSGIWTFRINTTFLPVYDLLLQAIPKHVNITQGENASFNFTLTNLGNTPVKVQLSVKGPLARYTVLGNEKLVPAGSTVTVMVTVTDTAILAPNTYGLILEVTYPEGVKEHRVSVTIMSGSGDSESRDATDKMGTTTWALLAALLVIILVFVVYVIRKRGEKKERVREDLDLLEAEIVEPRPVRMSQTQFPPMEERAALPQYAGTAAYTQWRDTIPSLATRSYGPSGNGGQLPRLPPAKTDTGSSAGEGQQPVPPPPDEQTYIPSPSVILPDFAAVTPSTEFKMLPPAPPSGMTVPRIHTPVRKPGYAGNSYFTGTASPPASGDARPAFISPPASPPSASPPATSPPPAVPPGSTFSPASVSSPPASSPATSRPISSGTPGTSPRSIPFSSPASSTSSPASSSTSGSSTPAVPPSSAPGPRPIARAPGDEKKIRKTPVAGGMPTEAATSRPSQDGVTGQPGGKGVSNTLDVLTRLIQDMPSTLDDKRKGAAPPEPPVPPG